MKTQRWAYLGLGVLMLVLGAFFYFNANQFRGNAEKATGTVVDFAAVGENTCPIVRFTTSSGQNVDAVADVCSAQMGDSVEIFYDPDQPDRIQVDNPTQSLYIPAFLVVFGLYCLVQGTGIIGQKKKT
jgi:hypothetical protein